ncbi:hypothetical protein CRG98_013419 [Punica granatum]|uniref:Uncharacterized protein n=1 Tax=Punica granatum TaxID=22663 RepID=A0A2I0KEF2_PUNGR|nr:hypothetical protein CRG98_013419 [Punica granatum]
MSDKEGSAAEAGAPTSEEADRLDRSVKRAKKLEVREGIRSKPLDAGVSQPAAQYKDMLIGGSQNTNGDFVDGLGWQWEDDLKMIDFTNDLCPKICTADFELANVQLLLEGTLMVERGNFARICVEVDLTRPLRLEVEMDGCPYRVEYEGLQLICFHYGRFGHSQSNRVEAKVGEAENRPRWVRPRIGKRVTTHKRTGQTIRGWRLRSRRCQLRLWNSRRKDLGKLGFSKMANLWAGKLNKCAGRESFSIRVWCFRPNVRRKRGEASWARDPVRNPSGDKTAQERGKANARPIQRFRGIEAHEAQCTSIPGCSSILNVNFELAQRILFQGKGQMEPGPKAQAQESLAGTVVPVTPTPTLGVETVQSNGPDFPGGNAAPMVVEERSSNFISTLRDYIRMNNPDILVIVEPCISGDRADRVCRKLQDFEYARVDTVGLSGGDFNAILSKEEKVRGAPFNPSEALGFWDTLDAYNLINLGSNGRPIHGEENKETFGDIQFRKSRALAGLAGIQRAIQRSLNPHLERLEREVFRELEQKLSAIWSSPISVTFMGTARRVEVFIPRPASLHCLRKSGLS